MADSPATRSSLLVRLRDSTDGPAWREFVDLYGPLIFRYGLRQGLQEADAADLTQDVLARVARALPRGLYDPERGDFRGWLFTVVRNQFRNVLERRGRQEQGTGDTSAQEALAEQPAPGDDAAWHEEYRRQLFVFAAEQVRPEMDAKAWQAFWRTGVEGRPAKDAAKELGMTVAAVYMAKSRVLARIKEQIKVILGADV
jgi:RNA polymerase sigma-70 factor (ECF subfamily)